MDLLIDENVYVGDTITIDAANNYNNEINLQNVQPGSSSSKSQVIPNSIGQIKADTNQIQLRIQQKKSNLELLNELDMQLKKPLQTKIRKKYKIVNRNQILKAYTQKTPIVNTSKYVFDRLSSIENNVDIPKDIRDILSETKTLLRKCEREVNRFTNILSNRNSELEKIQSEIKGCLKLMFPH